MLKVTIDSLKGKKLQSPMIVFVKTKASVDALNNRLIVVISQSEYEKGIDNFDFIGLKRLNVIIDNPELPKKASDLLSKGDIIAKEYIESLKLSQIVKIENK